MFLITDPQFAGLVAIAVGVFGVRPVKMLKKCNFAGFAP